MDPIINEGSDSNGIAPLSRPSSPPPRAMSPKPKAPASTKVSNGESAVLREGASKGDKPAPSPDREGKAEAKRKG